MSKLTLILGTLVSTAVIAGCGGPSSATDPPAEGAQATGQPPSVNKSTGPRLEVIDSDYGRILGDGRKRALYLFTADTGETSTCSGECAAAWPPWIVEREPRAAPGVNASLIGTTRRHDGRLQATYRGHPLYYYVRDRLPEQVLCQAVFEFGGSWLVVRSSGKAVR